MFFEHRTQPSTYSGIMGTTSVNIEVMPSTSPPHGEPFADIPPKHNWKRFSDLSVKIDIHDSVYVSKFRV